MAVTRTILPRKGFVQSQHGRTDYETDQDGNWARLDANVAFMADLVDLQYRDLGMNGVVSGFTLSPSGTLVPGITPGILYAQGVRYAPAITPSLGPAPPNATNFVFYNSASGFYYQVPAVGAFPGDALIGRVTTSASSVTSCAQGTSIFGQVAAASSGSGPFTVPHRLGRTPIGAVIQMTSAGAIWFQAGTLFDATNLYLAASAAGVTAQVQVW